jgi:hypothetical protein
MLAGLAFPFRFDPQLLKADLARILPEEWTPHYNERDYGGDWSAVALQSPSGRASEIAAKPGAPAALLDTPALERCGYFRRVVATFECPLKSVRLLSLAPQSFIREHTDLALGYEDGEIRIHVPIETNPGVEFYVSGRRLHLEEGHCYYLNVNLPHRVNNRGAAGRVHLVIDAQVNEWVHELFRRGQAEDWSIPLSLLPPRGFEEFRARVLSDVSLQEKLREIPDRPAFVHAAIELGRELGFDFHEADVHAAFEARRRELAKMQ